VIEVGRTYLTRYKRAGGHLIVARRVVRFDADGLSGGRVIYLAIHADGRVGTKKHTCCGNWFEERTAIGK